MVSTEFPFVFAEDKEDDNSTGIYVKAVLPGSAADVDGRIQAGDQIIAVRVYSVNECLLSPLSTTCRF